MTTPPRSSAFVDVLCQHIHEQFPRECTGCGVPWGDFADYVRGTKPIGAMCWDNEGALTDPLGTLSVANCRSCDSTVSLLCGDVGSPQYHAFVRALDEDAAALGVSVEQVLESLRDHIRANALA